MADPMTAEYRRSRGWSPDPGPTSRISLELPRALVTRLNRQARLSGIPRAQIAEAAIESMVREWEQIDDDETGASPGRPSPDRAPANGGDA